MAKLVLKDATVLVGALDLSANANQISVEAAAPEVDVTNFASDGNYECLGGIKSASMSVQGFWESAGATGNPDAELNTRLGTINPATFTLTNPAAAGDIAYFAHALQTQRSHGGMVGEVARLGLALRGSSPLVPGRIVETVTRTSTGNSAAYQLGATGASQSLYLVVHVTAASGTTPTLDLVIASDNASGFASGTTRITVPQITGLTSYYTTLAGAITDDYYRVEATVGGTDPSFTYVVALGIL